MKHKKESAWHISLFFIGVCLVVLLPALNIPPLFSPPDWGKAIVLRVIMGALALWWISRIVRGSDREVFELMPPPSFARHRIVLSFIILFSLFAISTLFSNDIYFSVWGSPSRAGGFLNLTLFFALAFFAGWIVSASQWKTLWLVSLGGATIVALIAILQYAHIFSSFLVPSAGRPTATLGGPIFLAIYLMINAGIAGMCATQATDRTKKWGYLLLIALFLFVAIFLASSRAVMVGIGVGALWFVFGYPTKKITLKLVGGGIILIGALVFGYFFFFPRSIPQKPDIVRIAITRVTSIPRGESSRTSSWVISWEAMKHRPIVGYGLENFAIGFDKYYDPSLPGIAKDPSQSSSWWDRAHNVFFDIGVQAGIPTLLAFLIFFSLIFIELQYRKSDHPEMAGEAHILQATLIAYLVANLFSFDTFSVFLMIFLIIGYVFSSCAKRRDEREPALRGLPKTPFRSFARAYSMPMLLGAGILLSVFVWKGGLEPLLVNADVNLALTLSKKQNCKEAVALMNRALKKNNGTIQTYVRLRFLDVASNCQSQITENIETFIEKIYSLMRDNTREMPSYVRNWIFLGRFSSSKAEYILKGRIQGDGKEIQRLFDESNASFERARQMSPKRQEVYVEWIKSLIAQRRFEEAAAKSQECITLNAQLGECWWMRGLTNIYLGKQKQFETDRIMASKLKYDVYSMVSFSQMIQAYRQKQDLIRLADVFAKMVETFPNEASYRVALAMAYRDTGEFGKARTEAIKAAELDPAIRQEADAFLRTLP